MVFFRLDPDPSTLIKILFKYQISLAACSDEMSAVSSLPC